MKHRVALATCDRCGHLVCGDCGDDIRRWGRGFRHRGGKVWCDPTFRYLTLSA